MYQNTEAENYFFVFAVIKSSDQKIQILIPTKKRGNGGGVISICCFLPQFYARECEVRLDLTKSAGCPSQKL